MDTLVQRLPVYFLRRGSKPVGRREACGAGEAAWREAKNIPNLNDLLASLGCRAIQEGARFKRKGKQFCTG